MERDEVGTLASLKSRRKSVLEPLVARHQGRVFKIAGDGVLVEFASAVRAVECAIDLQEEMTAANAELPEERRIVLRIGVNLGDVIVEGSDLYGDGVNIAARLEGIADPGGILISGSAYDQVRNKIEAGFEDLGSRNLKNIGEAVRIYQPRLSRRAPEMRPRVSLPDKPSIAVLPFVNMSGDPEQEFFADGLTEDIITALSRIGGLWVIARTSTFTYKDKPTDVKRVARELGVRYVMEGSARRAGERLRVTAQLIDAATGRHVWAERYDRALMDLFDIQDEITRSVAAETQLQVDLAELEASEARPATDFQARELATRAWARGYDQTPDAIAQMSKLAEEAIRIDPTNPVGHRARAAAFFNRLWYGEIPHDDANRARAYELAQAALRFAPRDEYAHLVMAWAHAHAEHGQLEEAVAECERGLEINTNCSLILGNLGCFLAALGRPQEAIEACRLALKLNPRDPSNFWRQFHISAAHFVAADYEASLLQSKRIARSRPLLMAAIIWAASAAALGNAEEARAAVDNCLAQQPDLRINRVAPHFMLRFARDEDHERLMALLRKAGLPE
jgi:TolB-like protein/Tfp pilus assembly protein PilF